MDLTGVLFFAFVFLSFALISGRLAGSPITPPMVFVLMGFAGAGLGLGVAGLSLNHEGLHLIAELTLILVLFADASRIDLRQLRRDHDLPLRLLFIGMPLTLVVGTSAAVVLFPHFSIWEAALLAAILTPTDAALGQAVVADKAVPVRMRQALNVESGLNDGLALPVVLVLASLASVMAGGAPPGSDHVMSVVEWGQFITLQLLLGPLVGAGAGLAGGWLIDRSLEREIMSEAFEGIAILALAIGAFALAERVGGNGFIAAFAAGLALGAVVRNRCTFLFGFMENEGQLLTLITFTLFGAAMVPAALPEAQPVVLLFVLFALTAMRMGPVSASLVGSGLSVSSHGFLGWFGPRGLASILFALLILEESETAHGEEILAITVLTVLGSTFLHGATAGPLATLYGRHASGMGACPETKAVSEMPLRNT